jgi:hypothetical protein
VVAALVDVLDGVRALGFEPVHRHAGRGPDGRLRLKQQFAAPVIPDPGRLIDDHYARRLVGVLGFAGSWLDHHVQHPYPVVLPQDTMRG